MRRSTVIPGLVNLGSGLYRHELSSKYQHDSSYLSVTVAESPLRFSVAGDVLAPFSDIADSTSPDCRLRAPCAHRAGYCALLSNSGSRQIPALPIESAASASAYDKLPRRRPEFQVSAGVSRVSPNRTGHCSGQSVLLPSSQAARMSLVSCRTSPVYTSSSLFGYCHPLHLSFPLCHMRRAFCPHRRPSSHISSSRLRRLVVDGPVIMKLAVGIARSGGISVPMSPVSPFAALSA